MSYFNEQIRVHSLSALVRPKTNIIFSPFLNRRMRILLSLYEHWGKVKNNYLLAQWNVFALKRYEYMLKKRAYALRLVVCVSRFASKPCCAILTKIKLCLCMCVPSCWVISNYFVTPWTVACQAPLFMGFPRQEYWSRLPFPSPWDLPNPGIKPGSLALQTDSLLTELQGKPQKETLKFLIRL